MGGFLLSSVSLVTGYVVHDSIAQGTQNLQTQRNCTSDNSLAINKNRLRLPAAAKDNQVTTSAKTDSSSKRSDVPASNPHRYVHDVLQEDLLLTGPGGWSDDIGYDSPDDPNRDEEFMHERESAYNRQVQILAEMDGQIPLSTSEPDEDALEDEYRYEELPEIGAQDALDMLEFDMSSNPQRSQQEALLPHEEEPPP